MKIRFLILMISLSPFSAIAGKGILYDIGERFIKMDGFSYEELEKKNETFLRSRNLCDKKTQPLTVSLQEKNQKLIGCPLNKAYKLYPNERDTGYSITDIMQTGCRGILKYKKEESKPNTTPVITEYTTNIIAQKDKTFRQLTLLRDKKRLFKPENEFIDMSYRKIDELQLEYLLAAYRQGVHPTVVLGRIYDNQNISAGQYGPYQNNIFQYNVMENEEKKLEVSINGQFGSQSPQTGSATITSYEIYCTAKSLAELENYAKNGDEAKARNEIGKKLFGD